MVRSREVHSAAVLPFPNAFGYRFTNGFGQPREEVLLKLALFSKYQKRVQKQGFCARALKYAESSFICQTWNKRSGTSCLRI